MQFRMVIYYPMRSLVGYYQHLIKGHVNLKQFLKFYVLFRIVITSESQNELWQIMQLSQFTSFRLLLGLDGQSFTGLWNWAISGLLAYPAGLVRVLETWIKKILKHKNHKQFYWTIKTNIFAIKEEKILNALRQRSR